MRNTVEIREKTTYSANVVFHKEGMPIDINPLDVLDVKTSENKAYIVLLKGKPQPIDESEEYTKRLISQVVDGVKKLRENTPEDQIILTYATEEERYA